jgi:aldose 1-epimerase
MAMANRTTLEIAAGEWRASVRPGVGGSLASLSRLDQDLLRPMPPDADGPRDAACFALVPYVNRIRRGRFRFGGRDFKVAANLPPERHSLNGIGWQMPWQVSGLEGAAIELVCDFAGDAGWPWPWRAVQVFALDDHGLSITLTLANTGSETMPAGLGLHPYFRRWKDTQARFVAKEVLLSDIELIPTGELAEARHFGNWAGGIDIPRATIDHCYTHWDGTVTITDGLGAITMTATGAAHLHVYAPGTGRDLCFEPVNHLPDALNHPEWGMPVLAPGEKASLTMRIMEN